MLGGSFDRTSPATIRQILQPLDGDAKISHVAYVYWTVHHLGS